MEWSKCSTPYSGTSWNPTTKLGLKSNDNGLSPEEYFLNVDSYNKHPEEGCKDPILYIKYRTGKLNRDWWFKHLGDLKREKSILLDEDYLVFLNPDCFCDLFGRWPRTHLVRWIYDNNYSRDMLDRDIKLVRLGFEKEQDGYRCLLP